MKNIVVKTISIILVFSLIISNIPISSAYAISNISYLDVIKEAMGDASSDNPAGDEIQYVRYELDWLLKLLRTSQKWLQSLRRAGLWKNYGMYLQ